MITNSSIEGHFKPVNNQLLSGYNKNKKRQQKENQLKLARKHCRSLKAIFGPSKNVQLSFLRTPKIWHWIGLLFKENS